MATSDDGDDRKLTQVTITRGQALGMEIARVATMIAGRTLREAGYTPTPEQFRDVARILSQACIAAGVELADSPEPPTDEDCDAVAQHMAVQAVLEACGLPPARVLN